MTRRQLIAMCRNNLTDGNDGVPVWTPDQKKVAADAEEASLVRIERTTVRFASFTEWRVWLLTGGVS